jgi:hypothetical protein
VSPLPALLAIAAGAIAVVVTRVQLLPDVIDFTVILNGAGLGGLSCMAAGAALRFGPDRLGRVTVFGQLAGGMGGLVMLVILLIAG